MADRQQTLQALKDTGVVAVIRAGKAEDLVDVGRALRQGGVQFIEITMTVPGAMTPTEVLNAWEAGADVVKIFPAGVGGELAGKPLIAARDFATITKNAADFLAVVQAAKKK